MKKNVLIIPCGSEIGLELHRSLSDSIHFELFGASSVDNHGKFVFKNYIGEVPFVDDRSFITRLKQIVQTYKIDFIFPAHDAVVLKLAQHQKELPCTVVTSSVDVCEITRSKNKTYSKFKHIVPTPHLYQIDNIPSFPVFLKPDIGQGSRGCVKAQNLKEVKNALEKDPSLLILEYLPGKEYTIDCFTNYKGELLFAKGRERSRISNGISVNSKVVINEQFEGLAHKINQALLPRGVWFFQVKERANGDFVLLEIAPRVAGAMGLYRGLGVNFAQLSLFDFQNIEVQICCNSFDIEMDRALFSRYKTNIEYDIVYVDLDDTLILNKTVNTDVIKFLYQAKNNNKQIYLISKHEKKIEKTVDTFCIHKNLFDKIIHLKKDQNKADFIISKSAIFIDDSFAERCNVLKRCNIPVFSLDMMDVLLEWKK